MTNMVYDKKTGRKRPVDRERSLSAKRAAKKRRNKHVSAQVRAKISKTAKATARTGRTQGGKGRRVVKVRR